MDSLELRRLRPAQSKTFSPAEVKAIGFFVQDECAQEFNAGTRQGLLSGRDRDRYGRPCGRLPLTPRLTQPKVPIIPASRFLTQARGFARVMR